MNKSVLLTNIQNIMTSLQLTIGKLDSLIAKDKSYYKEQIQKQITLLQVKLQDDNNYRVISSKSNSLETLIEEIQSEKNILKNLIEKVGIRTSYLNQKIDKNNSMLSYEQREIEALANGLNMTDNDEATLMRIKQKRVKLTKLKNEINSILDEIKINDDSIDLYNKKIRSLDVKEAEYSKELESVSVLIVDENKKNKDVSKLNRFLSIRDFISSVKSLDDIYLSLEELYDYLNDNRVDSDFVATKLEKMKAKISLIIKQVVYFVNLTNLDELSAEKSIITERIVSKNGYVLNDSEREMIYDEIASLQLAISLSESESKFDENVLEEYRNSLDKLDNEIELKTRERSLLQMEANDLVLKKNYFFNEYAQGQTDDISREIKRVQKQVDSIGKTLEKYIKIKTDVENTITFIKKKRKSSDVLRESKISDLRNIRETAFSRPTSKYNLNEDKQELIYMEFIVELIDFANYLLSQDYAKRLEDIPLETIEPFVSVVGFYKYDNLEVLYSDDFIMEARDTMEKMLSDEVIKPEDYIDELKLQGLTVLKFGKSLKSMEETKEVDKSVRLAA